MKSEIVLPLDTSLINKRTARYISYFTF